MHRRGLATLVVLLLSWGVPAKLARAQEAAANPDIERMKAQLAAQQEQIDQLRKAIDDQKKFLEEASRPKPMSLGEVASTTPVVPVAEPPAPLHPALAGALGGGQAGGESAPAPSPLQIHIGTSTITPVGFLDFTTVFRSSDIGSSIGTNFGATPYNSSVLDKLTETRLSAQNSRIGARIDALVHDTKVLAYWESDFLGTQATNAAVSTHSDSFRMRLYWVDLRRGNWEVLAGQSWSMLTPNRNGISPLPGDIFYSQDMDTNYQVGLTWTRAPQIRVVYHPSDTVTAGISFESAEQYVGGSSGGGAATLPNAFSTYTNTVVDSGASTYTTPNLHPDIQAKIAFDPEVNGNHLHIEFAGLVSSFKTANLNQSFTKTGGGGEANFNLEVFKNFHLIVNLFASDGGGRYLFGQAPDLVIRGNGAPQPLHADSAIGGFEWTHGNSLLYAYYGGDYIGRDTVIDVANNNALVGYGYYKSPTSQNRTIQENTIGLIQTFWKNPNYGGLSLITQYSYLWRNPWYLAPGAPRYAHNSMIWVDLRYTLPGQAPHY